MSVGVSGEGEDQYDFLWRALDTSVNEGMWEIEACGHIGGKLAWSYMAPGSGIDLLLDVLDPASPRYILGIRRIYVCTEANGSPRNIYRFTVGDVTVLGMHTIEVDDARQKVAQRRASQGDLSGHSFLVFPRVGKQFWPIAVGRKLSFFLDDSEYCVYTTRIHSVFVETDHTIGEDSGLPEFDVASQYERMLVDPPQQFENY